MNSQDPKSSSRRDLLKLASLASAGMGLASAEPQRNQPAGKSMRGTPFARKESVRIGVIGVGGRGNSQVTNFGAVPGVSFTAICDIDKDKTLRTSERIERTGRQSVAPALYSGSDHAFEQLVKRDDVDLVLVVTPWIWHVPMAVAAM